jgi:hypothetical protein
MVKLTSIAARMADFQPTLTHTYYVGDLCYVLTDDDWNTYCGSYDWKDCSTYNEEDGYDSEIWLDPEKFSWDALTDGTDAEPWRPCLTFSTAYGDGCYNDKEGNPYSVDSGGIGCIRVDYANAEKLAEAVAHGLGHLHEFNGEDLACGYDQGVIWFTDGNTEVEIDTVGGMDLDDDEEGADDAYDA